MHRTPAMNQYYSGWARWLLVLVLLAPIADATAATKTPTAKKTAASAFPIAPSFHPAADAWVRTDPAQPGDEPTFTWTHRAKPGFRVIHYISKQKMEPDDNWDQLLKKSCSMLTPELSAALSTNIATPKEVRIGTLPGCMYRIQSANAAVTEHYVFIWATNKERSRNGYQGHTLTVQYPPNYQAQGHEAFEKFLSSLEIPATGP